MANIWGHRYRMIVGLKTTYPISANDHWSCEFETRSWRGVLDTTLCDTACQWVATGWRFSQRTPASSTNKTDRHDITDIFTGTCFIQKIYAPSSSLLQCKYLPFSPSPLRLNIFRLFVILSLTQLYRYTPEIFLFSTATFKYTYHASLRRIGQEYSANVAMSTFQSLKLIQPRPVRFKLI